MNFPFYIARRYLQSKKSRNVVNIISGIAVVGVIVATTAMVVALSIFNGLEVLIKQYFSVFDSEIKITAVEGKQFDPNTSAFDSIHHNESVAYYCDVVEEIALLQYQERQFIAKIKGVNNDFLEMSVLDSFMYDGHLLLNDGNFDYLVIGRGIAINLGASPRFVRPITVSIPKKGLSKSLLLNPFRSEKLFLQGVYEVGQTEVDDQFALVTIDVARELLDLKNEVTSIEIGLKPGTNVSRFQKEIASILGPTFKVQNRYQQHESEYNVTKSERFFMFLILAFILIIASFNLAGAITMLILDKKKDIHILHSLGLTKRKIGRIFILEGLMVSAIGAFIGLCLGTVLSLGQMYFGWLKFPGGFVIQSYPVELRISNLVIIAITVLIIGLGASWLPVKLLPKRFFEITQD